MMILRGCYVAIVTPFSETGTVNEKALRSHIDFLMGKGVAGIVPCGTTGESATLSWEEHNHVVDIALEQAKGHGIQVIAGAGSNNTAESLAAARHARERGADAILCITPYYNRPTQEGLYQHFRAIATQVDIPMVVYNVPSRTGVNILPVGFLRPMGMNFLFPWIERSRRRNTYILRGHTASKKSMGFRVPYPIKPRSPLLGSFPNSEKSPAF